MKELSLFKPYSKSSFWIRIFGLVDQKSFDALSQENQELILINQRNMDAIKSLSDKLAQSLEFQQDIVRNIEINLKVVENIPQSQEHLQKNIHDSFERATFYIQNTCQDLLLTKSNLLSLQNEVIDSLGALELAEYMRSFLVNNLLVKQIKLILQATDDINQYNELDTLIHKLQNNLKTIQIQMEQINFKLEKYNLRIEESLWKPYFPEFQSQEKTEICNSHTFNTLLRISQQLNFSNINENTTSIIIGEIAPTISYFNKDKGYWLVKRRGKVVVLKSNQ